MKLAERVEVLGLLDELRPLEEQLTPNEREMVAQIRDKYQSPGGETFDDKICLEVVLRNIDVRRSFDMKPQEAAVRTIELPTAAATAAKKSPHER